MPLIYNINVIEAFLNAVKALYYICYYSTYSYYVARQLHWIGLRPRPLIDPGLLLGLRPRSLSPPLTTSYIT